MLPPELIAKLQDCARTNFAGMRDDWFFRQTVCEVVVIVGLIFEGPELLHELLLMIRGESDRFKDSVFLSKKYANRAKGAAFIGWIFIIGGLLGEIKASSEIKDFSASIEECSDAKVKKATLEAGDAATSATIARGEADTVKAEAKEIDGRLRAASKLIAMLGPRWKLLEDKKATFIKDLKPFAGQRIIVVSCGLSGPEATEPEKLKEDLMKFLAKYDQGKNDGAGWAVESESTTWAACEFGTESVPPGVGGNVLIVSPTSNDVVKRAAVRAANALDDELNKIAITTRIAADTRVYTAWDVLGPSSIWQLVYKDPTAVVLLVGTNPLFTLTRVNSRPK